MSWYVVIAAIGWGMNLFFRSLLCMRYVYGMPKRVSCVVFDQLKIGEKRKIFVDRMSGVLRWVRWFAHVFFYETMNIVETAKSRRLLVGSHGQVFFCGCWSSVEIPGSVIGSSWLYLVGVL